MKKIIKWLYFGFLYSFAGIGIIFVGIFFAIKYHVTDVGGVVDVQSAEFDTQHDISEIMRENESQIDKMNDATPKMSPEELSQKIDLLSQKRDAQVINLCKIQMIGQRSSKNAAQILHAYQKGCNDILISKMIFACELRLGEDEKNRLTQCQSHSERRNISIEELQADFAVIEGESLFPWMNDEEWQTIKEAIIKDREIINEAAAVAHIEPRLVVASAIVEQVRLFHSQRALYKQYFEPLKILGNATKISLGVMGIKEATAIQIEEHLKDSLSPYYLGKDYEAILNFASDDPASERFQRLTNNQNHYYSYLYGALYLKQMMSQWQQSGFDIQYRPEIVGTLFNVGFPQSHPNSHPKVGGSDITVGDAKYSFGSLAYEFYYSGELLEEFPFVE